MKKVKTNPLKVLQKISCNFNLNSILRYLNMEKRIILVQKTSKVVFYFFTLCLSSFYSNSQITERIAGGIQYSPSLNNYGENSPAAEAAVAAKSIDLDNNGNIILAHGNRIRKIDRHTGIITSLAGCNSGCTNTLGGPALSYSYIDPWCVSVDLNNDIYFLDVANVISRRVYKINATTLNIELVNGSVGIQADFISVLNGEVYYSKFSNQIYKINSSGIHELIAGTTNASFSGDNSWAISATMNNPRDIKVLPNGTIYFIDFGNKRIRKIENGTITTVAGNGSVGSSCSNCNPTNSSLQTPLSLDIDNYGNIFFVDHAYIKKINECDGLMYTIAGNGVIGITNTNMPPLQTSVYNGGYGGLCVDVLGNVNFITKGSVGGSTATNNHIYKIIDQATLDNLAGNDYHVCHGDSVNIFYAGTSPNFDWGFGNGINPSFLVNSNFYLILKQYNSNGCLIFSDEIEVIDVSLPLVVSVTDDYTCGIGYVKISANTNSVNSTIRWYSDSSSGICLFTGEQFTTPILTADSSFYAEAYDTIYQCTSIIRELVNAYINPPNSCTYIPDNVFESKLIQQNIDDQLNDFVKTSKIDTLQLLTISSVGNPNKVYDLTGIQDFVQLKKFYALENHLTNLDLSNNLQLTYINVQNNFIEFFNASMLPNLCTLRIHKNALTCLNINNNHNQILTELISYDNPNLTCIKVDNYNWVVQMMQQTPPTHYWWVNGLYFNGGAQITQEFCGTDCDSLYQVYGCTDDGAINYNYLANYDDGSCQFVGLNEVEESYFRIKPNPNDGIFELEINSEINMNDFKLMNSNGQIIYSDEDFSPVKMFNFSNLEPGVYFIQIDSYIPQRLIKL